MGKGESKMTCKTKVTSLIVLSVLLAWFAVHFVEGKINSAEKRSVEKRKLSDVFYIYDMNGTKSGFVTSDPVYLDELVNKIFEKNFEEILQARKQVKEELTKVEEEGKEIKDEKEKDKFEDTEKELKRTQGQ